MQIMMAAANAPKDVTWNLRGCVSVAHYRERMQQQIAADNALSLRAMPLTEGCKVTLIALTWFLNQHSGLA